MTSIYPHLSSGFLTITTYGYYSVVFILHIVFVSVLIEKLIAIFFQSQKDHRLQNLGSKFSFI